MMNLKKKLTRAGLLAVASLWILQPASAALLAYDGFDQYADGLLDGNNGGTGWSGAWGSNAGNAQGHVVSGGLSYSNGSVNIDGGAKAVNVWGGDTNNSGAILRQFTPTTANGDLYISFLIQATSESSGDAFIRMYLSNTTHRDQAGGGIGDLSTSEYRFGARTGKQAATQLAASTYATDTTHFLVGKLSSVGGSVYDTMDLWINPDSTTLGAPDVTASGSSNESVMNYWMMRNLNTAEGDYIYDEFRVGTTMESVVIPEPSTAVLFGGALLLFGCMSVLRRRS